MKAIIIIGRTDSDKVKDFKRLLAQRDGVKLNDIAKPAVATTEKEEVTCRFCGNKRVLATFCFIYCPFCRHLEALFMMPKLPIESLKFKQAVIIHTKNGDPK